MRAARRPSRLHGALRFPARRERAVLSSAGADALFPGVGLRRTSETRRRSHGSPPPGQAGPPFGCGHRAAARPADGDAGQQRGRMGSRRLSGRGGALVFRAHGLLALGSASLHAQASGSGRLGRRRRAGHGMGWACRRPLQAAFRQRRVLAGRRAVDGRVRERRPQAGRAPRRRSRSPRRPTAASVRTAERPAAASGSPAATDPRPRPSAAAVASSNQTWQHLIAPTRRAWRANPRASAAPLMSALTLRPRHLVNVPRPPRSALDGARRRPRGGPGGTMQPHVPGACAGTRPPGRRWSATPSYLPRLEPDTPRASP
jgi:hypothetical protein